MTRAQTAGPVRTSASMVPSRLSWFVLGLLFVAMVIGYVDRGNISYAAPFISKEFHLSATVNGYIFSAFLLGYSLMQIPAGRLVDRFGEKWIYAGFFLAWCLVAASLGLVQTAWQLIMLRVALGVTESVSGPASFAFIARRFPETRRGLASGVLLAGTKVGPALGAVVAAYLITSVGWRGLFVICGLAPMVWVFFWLWGCRNTQQLKPDETNRREAERKHSPTVPFIELLRHAPVWGIYLGYFCYGYLWYLLINWLPSFLMDEMHLSLKDTGWWAAFTYGGLALTAVAGGAVADSLIRRGHSKRAVRKGFVIAGFGFGSLVVLVPFLKGSSMVLFLLVGSTSGMGLATANTWAVTQALAPSGTVGTLIGIQNFGATSGGFLAPIVMGWLRDATGRFDAGFVCAGILMIAGVFSYLVLIKELEPLRLQSLNR